MPTPDTLYTTTTNHLWDAICELFFGTPWYLPYPKFHPAFSNFIKFPSHLQHSKLYKKQKKIKSKQKLKRFKKLAQKSRLRDGKRNLVPDCKHFVQQWKFFLKNDLDEKRRSGCWSSRCGSDLGHWISLTKTAHWNFYIVSLWNFEKFLFLLGQSEWFNVEWMSSLIGTPDCYENNPIFVSTHNSAKNSKELRKKEKRTWEPIQKPLKSSGTNKKESIAITYRDTWILNRSPPMIQLKLAFSVFQLYL